MYARTAEIKVFNNVLLGKIKVISANGRVVCSMKNPEATGSSRQRLKNSFLLLKLIRRLKAHQHVLTTARKKIIQIQIDSIVRG